MAHFCCDVLFCWIHICDVNSHEGWDARDQQYWGRWLWLSKLMTAFFFLTCTSDICPAQFRCSADECQMDFWFWCPVLHCYRTRHAPSCALNRRPSAHLRDWSLSTSVLTSLAQVAALRNPLVSEKKVLNESETVPPVRYRVAECGDTHLSCTKVHWLCLCSRMVRCWFSLTCASRTKNCLSNWCHVNIYLWGVHLVCDKIIRIWTFWVF